MLVNQRLCNSVQPEPEVDGLHLASSIPVYWLQNAPFFPWWMVHTHTWSSWNVSLFCSGDVCVCMYNMLMDVHVYLCIIYIYLYLGTYIDLYLYIHIQHDWNCWNTFSQWDCSCPNTHVGILSSLGCLIKNMDDDWHRQPRMATRETQQVTDKFYDGNLSDLEPSRVATSYYSQMAARDISWNC